MEGVAAVDTVADTVVDSVVVEGEVVEEGRAVVDDDVVEIVVDIVEED